MVLLNVKDGRKYFGDVRLFDNLNFHIDEGQKCGLVGANGAGKTSLFKVLTGEMELDSGDIFISPSASIGSCSDSVTPVRRPRRRFMRSSFSIHLLA